jgi:hypothetical protein
LAFCRENQGCYFWSTLPEGDDPPVFGRENDAEPWRPEAMTVSEHLILACLLEAIFAMRLMAPATTGSSKESWTKSRG